MNCGAGTRAQVGRISGERSSHSRAIIGGAWGKHPAILEAIGSRSALLEYTGRWDEVIALDEEILAKAGPSPAIRLWTLIRAGTLRGRRGESGVWECLDEAAVTADETGQPQWRVPARLARAEAHWLQDSES